MKAYLVITALLLTACAGPTVVAPPQAFNGQITNQAEFSTIVGRRLTLGDDFVVINADGTFAGNYGGVETFGTWEFRDGYFCRTVTQGPSGPDPENCQINILQGNTLTVKPDRGAGRTVVYTVT